MHWTGGAGSFGAERLSTPGINCSVSSNCSYTYPTTRGANLTLFPQLGLGLHVIAIVALMRLGWFWESQLEYKLWEWERRSHTGTKMSIGTAFPRVPAPLHPWYSKMLLFCWRTTEGHRQCNVGWIRNWIRWSWWQLSLSAPRVMMDGWHHAMQWLRWNSLNKAVRSRIIKGSILWSSVAVKEMQNWLNSAGYRSNTLYKLDVINDRCIAATATVEWSSLCTYTY